MTDETQNPMDPSMNPAPAAPAADPMGAPAADPMAPTPAPETPAEGETPAA